MFKCIIGIVILINLGIQSWLGNLSMDAGLICICIAFYTLASGLDEICKTIKTPSTENKEENKADEDESETP